MKKLKKKIKYHSAIIFPIFCFISLSVIDNKYGLLSKVPEKKMDALIGIIISIIGKSATVLTIYLSFPKNDTVKQRMKNTGHNHILLSNIWCRDHDFKCCFADLVVYKLLFYCYLPVLCRLSEYAYYGYYILVLSDFS